MDEKDLKQQSNIFDEGMKLANEGKYKLAIETLMPLTREGKFINQANCNIGVCYERLGDYENAKLFYMASNDVVAKHNVLKLFDNEHVGFTNEEYFQTCDYLIKRHNQLGYLYLSYIYQNDKRGVEDKEKAFNLLLEGFENCPEYDRLVFETAFLLERGCGCKEDHYKSHVLYGTILDTDDVVAKYNYAEQCLFGWGCEKDVEEAIKYLTIAGEKNYKDAIRYLVQIYTDKDEGFADEEKANYWKAKLERIGG